MPMRAMTDGSGTDWTELIRGSGSDENWPPAMARKVVSDEDGLAWLKVGLALVNESAKSLAVVDEKSRKSDVKATVDPERPPDVPLPSIVALLNVPESKFDPAAKVELPVFIAAVDRKLNDPEFTCCSRNRPKTVAGLEVVVPLNVKSAFTLVTEGASAGCRNEKFTFTGPKVLPLPVGIVKSWPPPAPSLVHIMLRSDPAGLNAANVVIAA